MPLWANITLAALLLSSSYPSAYSHVQSAAAAWLSPQPAESDQTVQNVQTTSTKPRTLGDLRKKYADTFKMSGPHSQTRQIALTFDDVPDPRYTPYVLDVLKKHNIKATFFIVGSRARKHPDLVRRIVKEGHVVGNHSFNHPNFAKLSSSQFSQQILRSERIIQGITGLRPKLIRPPYGEITEPQLRWARSSRYKIVNWNVDSMDWKGLSPRQIRNNVVPHTGPGSIILMHAGGGTTTDLHGTIRVLPSMISELEGKGYSFVTLPELLHVPASLPLSKKQ